VLLGVGRQTLRAALARLRDAGYVATRRGRSGGAVVQERWGALSDAAVRRSVPGVEELAELSDVRCLVESLIARTAAERRRPEHVEAMRAALDAFTRAEGATEIRRADQELHRTVVAAAGNRHLARMSRELLAGLNVGLAIEPYHDALLALAVRQHRALVAAIAAGDADAAAEVARKHFAITTDALQRAASRATSARRGGHGGGGGRGGGGGGTRVVARVWAPGGVCGVRGRVWAPEPVCWRRKPCAGARSRVPKSKPCAGSRNLCVRAATRVPAPETVRRSSPTGVPAAAPTAEWPAHNLSSWHTDL